MKTTAFLSTLDRSAIVGVWRQLCLDEAALRGGAIALEPDLVDALIHELDVDPDLDADLPSALLIAVLSQADIAQTAGVAVRQLRLIWRAFAAVIDDSPLRDALLLRLHVLIEEAMVLVSSRALGALDTTAHRDEMTGLLNRRAFERDISAALEEGSRPVGVVFADIDGLKRVNDEEGHEAGDRLIVRFAQALVRASTGRAVSVYRLGGDEHALLAKGVAPATVREVMRAARTEFGSFSWGAASTPEDGEDAATLLEIADAAMYAEKRARKAARRARERPRSVLQHTASHPRGPIRLRLAADSCSPTGATALA